ncbi:MAG: 16S rRNA (adenine(1518)-N(6)/adenine(1519)-N(6))-dimethyltransferase RsmA [Bacteroidota bacterium]
MFQPKKSLGQNFLTDPNIARKIVDVMSPSSDDIIVEIGPGKGILTSLLIPRVRHVVAVEIDHRAVEYLRARMQRHQSLTILHADILNVDLEQLSAQYHSTLRVIGNIPYYITTPILFYLIDHRQVIKDIQMMMQREVAQRLTASRGSKQYGILSVTCQYVGAPQILFSVSPNAFYPKPRVDSAIVRLTFFPQLSPGSEEEFVFRQIVRGSFGKRRKTLRNGLKALGINEAILKACGYDLDLRPEALTAVDFVGLTRSLISLGVNGHALVKREINKIRRERTI